MAAFLGLVDDDAAAPDERPARARLLRRQHLSSEAIVVARGTHTFFVVAGCH